MLAAEVEEFLSALKPGTRHVYQRGLAQISGVFVQSRFGCGWLSIAC
jgi:hypothetical protein